MTDRELMQMALDALNSDNPDIQLRAATHLRAALAQPEQEPTRSQKMRDAGITRRPKGWDKEQELEGINEVILNSIRDSSEVVAPPQREWVGLTDEEQNQVAWSCGAMSADWLDFARAIESKLRRRTYELGKTKTI